MPDKGFSPPQIARRAISTIQLSGQPSLHSFASVLQAASHYGSRGSYTFKSSLKSSCASRGALVRQVVPRLSTGLALASDECVWNGDVGRGENGELGPLLTTVESDRRRRIVLLLLLSAVVIEDLRAASWR